MHSKERLEGSAGTLFIVSTPIGNLKDITHRSLELLDEVDLIAAEDTRRTGVLLKHYRIKTPLSSFNSYNQERKSKQFLKHLVKGKNLALVSDAGTPGVSDPLYSLTRAVLNEGISVISAPGPSAVLVALTISGLPIGRFVFEGFLPRKKGRRKLIEELSEEKRTIVIFESPHRISKTLAELYHAMGSRRAVLARELTKMHEEVIRGSLEELALLTEKRKLKGEITLVIAGCSKK